VDAWYNQSSYLMEFLILVCTHSRAPKHCSDTRDETGVVGTVSTGLLTSGRVFS
jgi:hypothetical protein